MSTLTRFSSVILALGVLYGQVQSREKEKALGAALAAELRQRASLVADPAMDAHLAQLGAQLAAHLPGDHLPYSFAVIANDTTGGIHEPIALPGGYIFVPSALFSEAHGEAELAGMLAHAMAHEVVHHGSVWTAFPTVASEDGAIPAGALQQQRALETEADAAAVRMMAAAGYDPAALVRYIERVQPVPARIAALRQAIRSMPARP